MMGWRDIVAKFLLVIPLLNNIQKIYKMVGVKSVKGAKFHISHPVLVGSWSNLYMHNNAEINKGCFLLAKDCIEIGENSTLAYGVTLLTSANPNGPKNKLSNLYPAMTAPIFIGHDCWIGANSLILPGVSIGDFSIVAAGSVVVKDVPSGCLVAGNPAIVKKEIKIGDFL